MYFGAEFVLKFVILAKTKNVRTPVLSSGRPSSGL
jgi:hypothetical protein